MTAVGSTERILGELKRNGPLTASQLAGLLDITAEGARQHLLRLANAGLVAASSHAAGVGRPAQHWQLTACAQRHFPDAHADLALQLLESARTAFGDDGLEQLLDARASCVRHTYEDAMSGAATLAERVARLTELRAQEGYMAHWENDGDDFLLIEDHCPIDSAARACPNLCGAELTLFQQLLGAAAQVERQEHIVGGSRRCVYRISSV